MFLDVKQIVSKNIRSSLTCYHELTKQSFFFFFCKKPNSSEMNFFSFFFFPFPVN